MSNPGKIALGCILALIVMAGLVVVGSDDPPPPAAQDCLPRTSAAGPAAPGGRMMPMAAGTYEITSGFGPRWGTMHRGVDFAGPLGTPINAAASGTVRDAGPAQGFGNWIVLDHPDLGVATVYGHMTASSLLVHAGDTVTAGQPIATVGSEGGSTGPHLHFEVWKGTQGSGTAIDPQPWLAGAAEPGAPTASAVAAAAAPTRPAAPVGNLDPAAPPADGAEMAPLPAEKGSEANWQIDTVRLARAIAIKFPQITDIGGWRADGGGFDDHPSGRAADVMIDNYTAPESIALGDAVVQYVLDNKDALHVEYLIWRQRYIPAEGEGNLMEDRRSDNDNHFNHAHITVVGGGMPAAGQLYGPLPGGGAPAPAAAAAGAGCTRPQPGGTGLRPGSVPPEFEPWILAAAKTCPEITAPLLAGQTDQESGGFNARAYNATSGASGPAQFLPSSMATEGVDGDGDGTKDPYSIPDAMMSMAAYDCKLLALSREGLQDGSLTGDAVDLALSMYNCGPGAVQAAGGICGNAETQGYAPVIRKKALELYTDTSSTGAATADDAIASAASRWDGAAYVWGGGDAAGPTASPDRTDPDLIGFDDAGLIVHAVATARGLSLPHTVPGIMTHPAATPVATAADLRPGDIVQTGPDTAGIWVADDTVITAPPGAAVGRRPFIPSGDLRAVRFESRKDSR